MKIVHYSLTGNTRAFAERFTADRYEVQALAEAQGEEPYVLFTPTYNFGQVPDKVSAFLQHNSDNLIGVVAFGNRNWGAHFAKAGDSISEQYGVPLLGRVELRGTDSDYNYVKERLNGGIK